MATGHRDETLVQLLLRRWRDPESGLDLAETNDHEVLLSFPRSGQPNAIHIGKEASAWLGGAGKLGGGSCLFQR